MSQQLGPSSAGTSLVDQIAGLLARPPSVKDIDLDVTYFKPSSGASELRVLVPDSHSWESANAGKPNVPLQVCEFLAYKSALAYETETRIRNYLTLCCRNHTNIAWFDSTMNGSTKAQIQADSQAYGFVFEGRAFVVFRGTKSNEDWAINRSDTMTDELGAVDDRRMSALRKRYAELLDVALVNPSPGRHVGFSIAWAAIKGQVEKWLADVLLSGEATSIVYTGHSLGGAMAQVAAFDHARMLEASAGGKARLKQRIFGVVTFGAPMVGGKPFADRYKDLLGDRTVLLESSGDIVPRIMNRWYYRMLYPLRQRIKGGLHLRHQQDGAIYSSVASPWGFASEPPLDHSDIDSAVNGLRAAAQKAAKDLLEAREKAKREEAEKTARGQGGASDRQHAPASPGKNAAAPDKSKPGDGGPGSDGGNPSLVYWIVIGGVVVAVAGVTWYFVRRKLFSHDIEQRYALYLSTLSYQQLRATHGGDLVAANTALDEHLHFVRGNLPGSPDLVKGKPFFETVQQLPLKLQIKDDPYFVEFLKSNETFV